MFGFGSMIKRATKQIMTFQFDPPITESEARRMAEACDAIFDGRSDSEFYRMQDVLTSRNLRHPDAVSATLKVVDRLSK